MGEPPVTNPTRWTHKMIHDACARLARGEDYAQVAEANGVSRDSVAGLVYRLRFHKDPRLPAALIKPHAVNFTAKRSAAKSASIDTGHKLGTMANHPPLDDAHLVRMPRAAAAEGSRNLLRAQLRAGQHLLEITLARALAATIGMKPNEVRPA